MSYVDMAVRGRPTSSTPEKTVEALSDKTGIPVPGDEQAEQNRVSGLGPLTGLLAGVGIGGLLGVTDARTWPAKPRVVDIVPHFAYGVVTAAVLERLDD